MAAGMPRSVLEEELMDFESAAAHFTLTDEWGLSELDEEAALQGIVGSKTSTTTATSNNTGSNTPSSNTVTPSSTPNSNNYSANSSINGARNSLKLSSSPPSRLPTMKIESSSENSSDIFGCGVRYGSSNGFGGTTTSTIICKARPTMISAKYRLKEERRKVVKISLGKLKRIEDADSSLCRTVLINNTMKRLQREAREEKLQRQGIYQPTFQSSYERSEVKSLVPTSLSDDASSPSVTLSLSSSTTDSVPVAPVTPTSITNSVESAILTLDPCTPVTEPAEPVSRKRTLSAGDDSEHECDVQDVLSHFYMPPTPRLLTSIDDEEEVGVLTAAADGEPTCKKQCLLDLRSTSLSVPTSVPLNDTDVPSSSIAETATTNTTTGSSSLSPPSSPPAPSILDERLQQEPSVEDSCCDLASEVVDVVGTLDAELPDCISERFQLTTTNKDDVNMPEIDNNQPCNNHECSSDDEDIDVVNETSSSPFDDATSFSNRLCEEIGMDTDDDCPSSRLRDFTATDILQDQQQRYINNSSITTTAMERRPCGTTNNGTCHQSPGSPPECGEQQHFSCGHSSIFGELQSVVFHSLIASLES